MQTQEKNKFTFKDKLEIVEAIFTIVVSIMAIWGTLVAWENGFWHKLKSVTDHLHSEYASQLDKEVEKKAVNLIKKVDHFL